MTNPVLMGNPVRGHVEFEAEGERYTLRYSIDALCSLEESTGKTFIEIATELSNASKLSVGLLRKVFWAGLRKHHPDMTPEEAGELIIAAGGAFKVLELMEKAFQVAFPQESESKNPPKPGGQENSGTGPDSIRRGAESGVTKKRSGSELREN